jgi:hypothetical protein
MEDEPADRPANAQDLADRLEAALQTDEAVPLAVAVINDVPASAEAVSVAVATKRNRAAEIRALQKQIEELSRSPAGPSGFAAWHKRKFGSIPLCGQIIMWTFYGFFWIPIYYLFSGKAEQTRREQSQSLEQEIKRLQERVKRIS